MIKIFLLMILCHILDDFVFQPVCLSNMKQKTWWKEHMFNERDNEPYKNDHIAALVVHSISWSIMINLPLFFLYIPDIFLLISVILNAIVHFFVDDLKANKKKINLCFDQSIHFIQILVTFLFFFSI